MISHLQNPASGHPPDADPPAALRTIIGSTLLAGLVLAAAAPRAAADPAFTFGAFAKVYFAGNDGGWNDYVASIAWGHSNAHSGYTVAAAANLVTGSLHASSMARLDCPLGLCASPVGWVVSSQAQLFDRYVFTNEGENIAFIPVSLRVDGHCAGDAHTSAHYRFAFSSTPINISTVPYRRLPCDGSVDVVAPINLFAALGEESYYAFVEISTGVTFDSPATPGGWGLSDFGNTLKVDIVLPDGVTMRSDSGVFPSRRETTEVPEPATLGMLGAGLAVLGAVRSRARRRRIGRA